MEKSDLIKVRGRNFYCQLCDIKITSEGAVNDHLKGKKHQRLLSHQESRQQQIQRSIYVGGLSRLNGELQLGDYFSKFGEVAQIIIDKEKAHYAIVEFANDESAKSATNVERQVMNGQKIVVRPRQPKTSLAQDGSPLSRQAGRDGRVKGKSSQEQSKQNQALYQKLAKDESVSEQMSTLVQMTELTEADGKLRHLVCDLLQSALEELLPGCHITPFGSSINGFGVQGCDLDIHLDSGESVTSTHKMLEDTASSEERTGPADDRNSPDLTSDSPLEILSLVSDVIKRCIPSCHSVHFIPSARLPVVKFTHKESGLECDVSMNNRLALQNTKLLKFYSTLAPQVRPLVFTVRHWAKLRQLAGNTGAGPRLTNYALTLMVLFYLQAKDKSLLPSVAMLEQSGDGWDSVFSQQSASSTSKITETQGDLLAGFFSFYDDFDFATSVICPLYGKTASLCEVTKSEACDDSRRSYKTGAINVRDPFELWHNVALNVNEKTLERLSVEFASAAKFCQSEKLRELGGSFNHEKWGLLAVFDPSSSKAPSLTKSPSVISTGSASDDVRLEISLRSSHLSPKFIVDHPDSDVMKAAWCGAVKQLTFCLLSEVLKFDCRWLPSDATEESSKDTVKSAGEVDEGGIDSTIEGSIQSAESESGDAPPSKRCKVDLGEGDVQDTVSHQHITQDTDITSRDLWESETGRLECTAYHPVWLGRRKARRHMVQLKSQEGSQTKTDSEQPCIEPLVSKGPNVIHGLTSSPQGNVVDTSATDDILEEKVTLRSRQDCTNSGDASLSKGKTCHHQAGHRFTGGDFLLERQVTELIISEKLQRSPSSVTPIMRFSLSMGDRITKGNAGSFMLFRPESGEANVKVFLHFFEIFFKKILDQCKI